MSKKTINIGIDPDDGTGDPLRTSMDKINSNFTEFYDAITPTGKNVGIGTTTPSARLNVVSDTSYEAVKITQTGSGNALVVQDIDNDTSPFVVTSTGSVGIGKTTPIYPLDVNGDIKTSSKLRFSSDNRYLSYESGSYVLPNANLYVYNSLALTVNNFNDYAPTLAGYGAYGFWENVSVNNSVYSEGSFTNTFTIGTGAYHVANGNLGINTTTPQAKIHSVTSQDNATAILGYSELGFGVFGESETSYGVLGYTNSSSFAGVAGASVSDGAGVYAESWLGTALVALANTGNVFEFQNNSVNFAILKPNGNMAIGHDFVDPTSRLHVFTTGGVMAIQGESFSNSGVSGYANTGMGTFGSSWSNNGVGGYSNTGVGVEAISFSNTGMGAFSNTGYGISGTSKSNTGIGAYSNTGMGIQGTSISNTGGAFYSNTGVGLQVYSNSGIIAQFSNNTQTVLTIDNKGLLRSPQQTKTSTSAGTAGDICWDANYIYVCTATNTWKRAALTGGSF